MVKGIVESGGGNASLDLTAGVLFLIVHRHAPNVNIKDEEVSE